MRKVAFTLPALQLSSRHSLCQLLTAQLGHLVPIRCPSSCYDDNMFDPHQGQGRQVEAMLSWKPGPSPRLSQPRFRRIPLRVAGYHSPIHAIHFLVFDAIPGRVFKGKVRHVLDAIATRRCRVGGPFTLKMIRRDTIFPAERRLRSPSTRPMRTTSPFSGAPVADAELGEFVFL